MDEIWQALKHHWLEAIMMVAMVPAGLLIWHDSPTVQAERESQKRQVIQFLLQHQYDIPEWYRDELLEKMHLTVEDVNPAKIWEMW